MTKKDAQKLQKAEEKYRKTFYTEINTMTETDKTEVIQKREEN